MTTDTFLQGAISPLLIADSIYHLSKQSGVGGHGIFLGQVRNDLINDQRVKAIEYTVYEQMAIPIIDLVKSEIKEKYALTSIHIHHSLGRITVGELCLFVLTSARNRKPAIDACQETVERIKAEVPIWGKEIFENDGFAWKVNT